MTVEELEELRQKAVKTLGCWVTVFIDERGWNCSKKGNGNDDMRNGTFEQAVVKLREWARPPKPANLSITLPYEEVSRIANIAAGKFADACREAIAPYES